MKDSFENLITFCKESIEFDPCVNERGFKKYCEEIITEAEEILEGIKKQDTENIKEELGDVFVNLCYACIIAENENLFSIKDVLNTAKEKLQRRKPYVLEKRKVTAENAREIWKKIKQQEKESKLNHK